MRISAAALTTAALAATGLAACGSSSNSSSSTASQPAKSTAAPTPVSMASKAKVGEVLVNSQGFTLYHLTKEQGGKIACTGSCTSLWVPLTVTGSGPFQVKGGGALTVVQRPDGTRQLAYRGEPLYRFTGDSSRADANGQGLEGTWFAVAAKATAKPAAPRTTTSTSKGYSVGGGY
jgi:predicted lipoprotein with Yx(FWY)xxD motif